MNLLRSAALATFACLSSTTYSPSALAVVGGEYLDSMNPIAQSTVGLVSYNEGDTTGEWCTGSIVAPHLILTAAHCLSPELNITKIIFSADLRDEKALSVIASHRIPHPKFTGNARNKRDGWDIGIVRFEEEIPTGFQPIKIPEKKLYSKLVSYDSTYWLAGFGDHSYFDTSSEFRLKSASLQFMQYDDKRNHIQFFQRTSGALCSGDSGGPLIVFADDVTYLVGVASISHSGLTLPETCGDTSTFTAFGNKDVRKWLESFEVQFAEK